MARPKVIDLFSGVGGFSLGAARAGFDVVSCVELDGNAITTHARNFRETRHLQMDVSALSGAHLLELSGVTAETDFGLIGGPPCQGFSEIGRRVLGDPRNNLFAEFFRLVSETRPAFFLAENVPGVLADRNRDLVEGALGLTPTNYIVQSPVLVDASDHGAPTIRRRVFFYGYDPARIDHIDLSVVSQRRFKAPLLKQALAGMPRVRSSWKTEEQGWRRIKRLGSGPYFDKLWGDVPPGIGCPFGLEQLLSNDRVSGCLGTAHTDETVTRFSGLAQGDVDPVSRGVRLRGDGYAPTLRAGTGPERGSFQAVRPVHMTANRVVTPREAARIQGFPDWFQFHPTKWHSFRQIGNSVSPLVAENLLNEVRGALAV